MPAILVFFDCLAGAAPDAIWTLYRIEPAALGCPAQGDQAEVSICQGCQRDHSRRASNVRHDEPVQVVVYRARDQLAERSVVTGVGSLHRRPVSLSPAL